MDWLKEYLGDMFEGVKAKLEAAGAKVKLANLAEGGYVAKDKFDAMETRAKTAEKTVTERDASITELKKVDPAQLQTRITELETANATQKTAHEEAVAAMRQDTALNAYLGGHKFTSDLAREAVFAKLKGAALKLGEDGKLVGADDVMKGIREKNPGAFEPPKQESRGLFTPPPQTTPAGSMAAALAERMNVPK
jgi:hypothetical protein